MRELVTFDIRRPENTYYVIDLRVADNHGVDWEYGIGIDREIVAQLNTAFYSNNPLSCSMFVNWLSLKNVDIYRAAILNKYETISRQGLTDVTAKPLKNVNHVSPFDVRQAIESIKELGLNAKIEDLGNGEVKLSRHQVPINELHKFELAALKLEQYQQIIDKFTDIEINLELPF